MFPVSMNLPPSVIGDHIVAPQPSFEPQPAFPPIQNTWVNSNNSGYGSYQLPLRLSQYYNVFPEVPSTKTSWTFPNGCVTSNIVRFTGLPTPSYPVGSAMQLGNITSAAAPVKRKSLPSDLEPQPNKVRITEEKMTARMSGMHISNEFVSYNETDDEVITNVNEMDEELPEVISNDDTFEPKLVVCDELKDFNRNFDSILPKPLIPADKSSTALVIWRPPVSYVNDENEEYTPRSSVIITDITDRPDLENNNISTVDLNRLILPPKVEYPPDSMDAMEL